MNKRVTDLQQAVNKAMGHDVLLRGSDPKFVVKYLRTGVLPFDILLQGGLPRGRFSMITGDWSTLKSYFGLCAIRETQLQGGIASLIDTEHAFDPDWAASVGVNVDDLLLQYPENGEQAIDTAETLIRSNEVDLIVIDSVAATLPQQEQEKRLYKENIQPGRQAALMSAASRRMTTANSGKTAVLWVNQLRENIGMTFGPREKAPGGRALPFYSSYILEVKKVGKITRDTRMYTGEKWQTGKEQIGQKFRIELSKSKLNKPYRDIWFDWSLEEGEVDIISFLFAQGLEHGLITAKGASYVYGNVKAVGKDKFKAALAANAQGRANLTAEVTVANNGDKPVLVKPAAKKQMRKRLVK
jgi:recombination protein RecA